MNPKLFLGLGCIIAGGCGALADDADDLARETEAHRAQPVSSARPPVGLSLFFTNGAAAHETLVAGARRYVQEIDIVESAPSATDEGITPLIESSRFSSLNWTGTSLVEEIWVPSLDGTFTRERYYRGARWMEQTSVFTVQALDASGAPLGAAWVVRAGRDDRQVPADDTFIRRFDARQLAFGCVSVGDCSGASYLAEALVQARGALHPVLDSRSLPPLTSALRLAWNRLPSTEFTVAVDVIPPHEAAYGSGFQIALEPISTPANGLWYAPGESLSLRMSFLDGSGQRLHPLGELPSYSAYAAGHVESGLGYLDLTLLTRLYYALKHRESNLLVVLSGPTDQLRTPQTVVDPALFFAPQVPFATVAVDGFTAIGQTIPPAGIIFGGLSDPSLWSLPVSDVITLSIPEDAEPGTYVAAIKARRDDAGEALNRGTTIEIQVGQTEPSAFTPATTCASCHSGERTSFKTLLHGLDDRRACFGCHASLGIETDNALDIRVHAIHDRSDRFDADIRDCALCHLTPPSGPQRGVLP
jgi:predicted CXXCH cytochrome family protein